MQFRDPLALGSKFLIAFFTDDPHPITFFRQPEIGIVGTQIQTIFRTGGKHPVRFVHALGNQVVNHYADISFRTVDDKFPAFAFRFESCVDTGQQSLSSGFFIAGRTVNLSGKEQTRHLFQLQTVIQFLRIDIIVLNRIGITDNTDIFQPLDGMDKRFLHIGRERGGNAVGINDVGI